MLLSLASLRARCDAMRRILCGAAEEDVG